MALAQASTLAPPIQLVARAIAHTGEYGTVSTLSRQYAVSRQTVYSWAARGRAALAGTFTPARPVASSWSLERVVLTLLAEGHAGERGIQACLAELRHPVSVGTIHGIIHQAQHRALALLGTAVPPGARAVALDEIYGNDRHGGYLSIVDAQAGAVWAVAGPLAVDHDSWALLLWAAQGRGLRWHSGVTDGGSAMQAAWATVSPASALQRDVWHVLHDWAKVQARLDRAAAELEARAATVARQAARLAAGQRPRGGKPQTDPTAHAAHLAQARRTAEGLRYLSGELGSLLDVVVLVGGRLRPLAARQADLACLLTLLADLGAAAPPTLQGEVARLHSGLTKALPALLAFVPPLESVQQQVSTLLDPAALGLLAWAWQRRAILGPTSQDLLDGLVPAWRPAAALLLAAWDQAVRASSLVENWHSVLRPHLAVHRTLSAGMLALLAVWHNHRVAPRGAHQGTSPLSRSGLAAPADWLVALGYPPRQPADHRTATPTTQALPMAA